MTVYILLEEVYDWMGECLYTEVLDVYHEGARALGELLMLETKCPDNSYEIVEKEIVDY